MARKGLCDPSVRPDTELETRLGAALWVPRSRHPQAGCHPKVFSYGLMKVGRMGPFWSSAECISGMGVPGSYLCTGNPVSLGDEAP